VYAGQKWGWINGEIFREIKVLWKIGFATLLCFSGKQFIIVFTQQYYENKINITIKEFPLRKKNKYINENFIDF
jgi:hypothetical protein